MHITEDEKFAVAIVVAVVFIISFISWQGWRQLPLDSRRGTWVGGRGPYNLQLYDSPRYYPSYEGKDYTASWDEAGRCSAYCRASDDGGCAVACR